MPNPARAGPAGWAVVGMRYRNAETVVVSRMGEGEEEEGLPQVIYICVMCFTSSQTDIQKV
jgi:hypothetical protein